MLLMIVYDHLLPRKVHKTSRILFDNALEFVCDVLWVQLWRRNKCDAVLLKK